MGKYETFASEYFGPRYKPGKLVWFGDVDYSLWVGMEDALSNVQAWLECIREKDWSSASIKGAVNAAITDTPGMTLKQLAPALRMAVSGQKVTPPIFETLEILGIRVTLYRLGSFITRLYEEPTT